MKTINNELIRSFKPCYDPSEHGIPDNETLSAVEWVSKYRGIVPDKDILWLLLREHFYSAKDLRLFAVWCAREAFKLVDNPAPRSIEAVNVAERYANGDATYKQLASARVAACGTYAAAFWYAAAAAWHAAWESDTYAAWYAADAATSAAVNSAAFAAAEAADATTYYDTARKQQLDYLLNNFIML